VHSSGVASAAPATFVTPAPRAAASSEPKKRIARIFVGIGATGAKRSKLEIQSNLARILMSNLT
jgi:hypothetical protein